MSKAVCRTCGAYGPPWEHVPSLLDPDGVGDIGHKLPGRDKFTSHAPHLSSEDERSKILKRIPDGLFEKFYKTIKMGEPFDETWESYDDAISQVWLVVESLLVTREAEARISEVEHLLDRREQPYYQGQAHYTSVERLQHRLSYLKRRLNTTNKEKK